MEKVTIDYNRLCLELEKQGKTKADLSRDMTKNKNFVGLMEKNPDQPAEVERLMCLLLGLEQGSLIKQEEATGSQGEIKILENLHKEMREIHQAIIEYGELIEKIWSKVHANTLQLEKVKEDVKECAQVLKMTDYDKAVRFLNILNDIFLRMLKPEELKLMQGFPKDYIIDRDYRWKSYPITKQVARIGNSVVPIMAQKLVGANCPYLKVGERLPNFRTEEEGSGQIRFV